MSTFKLISADASVFSARVRAVIYAKDLLVEIVPPPADLRGADYLEVNPIGKLPVLLTDCGLALPESEVIVEYLEDRFPGRALLPQQPEARARARLVARVADLYVMPAVAALFHGQVRALEDPAIAAALRRELDSSLDLLQGLLGGGDWAVGTSFSTADCALYPILLLARRLCHAVNGVELQASHPRLHAYCAHCETDPVLSRIKAEFER